MDFQRRITLYLFGIIIGGGVAYWIYGKRLMNSGWLPDEKVKQRLRSTLVKATPAAGTQLAAWPADLGVLRAAMDSSARVDFSASKRTDDSIIYVVHAQVAGRAADLFVATLRDFDRDSTATLLELQPGR